jgi:hypothetical protein
MLDRLRREHPEEIGDQFPGGVRLCPEDLGYEPETACEYFREQAKGGKTIDKAICMKCWDRPFPEDVPEK